MEPEDSGAISELVDDSSKILGMSQSFYKIFLQQQKYWHLKDKRSMCWNPLIIRFALSVKYSSTSAYQTLGPIFALPSLHFLRDYTHWINFPWGGG